jgi:hypothetical protein
LKSKSRLGRYQQHLAGCPLSGANQTWNGAAERVR